MRYALAVMLCAALTGCSAMSQDEFDTWADQYIAENPDASVAEVLEAGREFADKTTEEQVGELTGLGASILTALFGPYGTVGGVALAGVVGEIMRRRGRKRVAEAVEGTINTMVRNIEVSKVEDNENEFVVNKTQLHNLNDAVGLEAIVNAAREGVE
jgi:hypothetical protein